MRVLEWSMDVASSTLLHVMEYCLLQGHTHELAAFTFVHALPGDRHLSQHPGVEADVVAVLSHVFWMVAATRAEPANPSQVDRNAAESFTYVEVGLTQMKSPFQLLMIPASCRELIRLT